MSKQVSGSLPFAFLLLRTSYVPSLELRYSSRRTLRETQRLAGSNFVLDKQGLNRLKMLSVNKTYSTKEVARKVGVHWVTLHKWMAAGKIRPSLHIGMNGGKHWRWTQRDVEAVIRFKAKNYRKG